MRHRRVDEALEVYRSLEKGEEAEVPPDYRTYSWVVSALCRWCAGSRTPARGARRGGWLSACATSSPTSLPGRGGSSRRRPACRLSARRTMTTSAATSSRWRQRPLRELLVVPRWWPGSRTRVANLV
uniref:Uncharacterized protein n=1 Tax=Arundo donax TaxID=35708 RepID=A0A0A9SP07_ARUDO